MDKAVEFFHSVLRAIYEVRLSLEKTCSIGTWATQSVGNRDNSFPVKVVGKVDNKVIMVNLPANWMPARHGAGYTGKPVNKAKNQAKNTWSAYANRNAPDPTREVMALIGYFTEQIITGIPLSYENSGKILFLDTILTQVKFTELTVEFQTAENPVEIVKLNLGELKSLVSGLSCTHRRFTCNLKAETDGKTNSRVYWTDDDEDKPAKRQPAKRQPAKRQPKAEEVEL